MGIKAYFRKRFEKWITANPKNPDEAMAKLFPVVIALVLLVGLIKTMGKK